MEDYFNALAFLASAAFGFGLSFSLTIRLIDFIVTMGKKKSYETEMSIYDGTEAKAISLPSSKLSLADLLQDDGEIPDKFLGGE